MNGYIYNGDNGRRVGAENPLPTQLRTTVGGDPFAPPVAMGRYTLTVDTTGTDNDLGALLGGTVLVDAIAAGLVALLVTVETNDVRVAFDNTDPSSNGLLYGKGNTQPYVWDCSDFTKLKIAGQGGSATLRVALFK